MGSNMFVTIGLRISFETHLLIHFLWWEQNITMSHPENTMVRCDKPIHKPYFFSFTIGILIGLTSISSWSAVGAALGGRNWDAPRLTSTPSSFVWSTYLKIGLCFPPFSVNIWGLEDKYIDVIATWKTWSLLVVLLPTKRELLRFGLRPQVAEL